MLSTVNIKYLTRDAIDTTKWDRCIEEAGNGSIYGYSFYLDHMSKQWDALVLGDYQEVMPLTWNKKYGTNYLYQPFLSAQLGLFGENLSAALMEQFLEAIPKKFRFWDIYLNHGNLFSLAHFTLYQRSNFVLELARPYELIIKNYSENIRRNIKKAVQQGCVIKKEITVNEVIALCVQQTNVPAHDPGDFKRFRALFDLLHNRQQATTYGVVSATGQLLSSAVFFFAHQRAYYILVGNHPTGREVGASHTLIDAFIRDHAGKKLSLDFEGSDIPNLANFYKSFGATEEPYTAIRLNRLPLLLRWMKS